MYKWFVWSPKLQKYLPLPGLSLVSRDFFPADLIDIFGNPAFSIPFFGVHNAVKKEEL